MEWGKLFANLPDDPRVQAAEDTAGAGFLLIESMCYCTSAETDGFIPFTQVERFGGGPKKKQKVAALILHEIWLPVDRGYLLNPELWTEEKNLSDSAEQKRRADRERVKAKRAREKAGMSPEESRDCRATSRATSRRDSRVIEKRREEKTFTAEVVSHLPVADARTAPTDSIDSIDSTDPKPFTHWFRVRVAAEYAEHHRTEIDDATADAITRDILGSARTPVIHPLGYVLKAIADEVDPRGRWATANTPRSPSDGLPAWCGSCDEDTRQLDRYGDSPRRCPACHPEPTRARTA